MTTHGRLTGFLVLTACLFAALIFALAGEVQAQPRVTGYTPNTVDAGAAVTIMGNNFGASQGRTEDIRYGGMGSTAPAGTIATIRRWSATAIDVQLPTGIFGGTYWLAIYDGGRLRSNQLAGLTVRPHLGQSVPGPVSPLSGLPPLSPEVKKQVETALPLRYDVTVILESLQVVNTGDARDRAKWILVFAAWPDGARSNEHRLWPAGGTVEVVSGLVLTPNAQIVLRGVPGNGYIRAQVFAVACVNPGPEPVVAALGAPSYGPVVNCPAVADAQPTFPQAATYHWASAQVGWEGRLWTSGGRFSQEGSGAMMTFRANGRIEAVPLR